MSPSSNGPQPTLVDDPGDGIKALQAKPLFLILVRFALMRFCSPARMPGLSDPAAIFPLSWLSPVGEIQLV
jgi:hypothetical protein